MYSDKIGGNMANIVNVVDGPYRSSLSFVVPVKDEQATLETLFCGIAAQATSLASSWEVIFIDDGSSDDSWKVIQRLAAQSGTGVPPVFDETEKTGATPVPLFRLP
jgi:cellulose synthase/poly-beta-1,6-N-acetylglucosamine synthase-like glycosyltransferase